MPPRREVLCVLPFEYGLAQQLYQGMQAFATQADAGIRVHLTVRKDEILDLAKTNRVSGLICFGGIRGIISEPLLRDFPMVNVSAYLERSPVPMVVNDDEAAGQSAGMHLARTRPRTAVCVSPPKGCQYILRGRGACRAFTKAGIPYHEYTLPFGESGSFSRRNEYVQEFLDTHAREILFGTGTHPLAVVCSDYRTAELLVLKAHELKLNVPEAVRVVGIGNPTDRFSFLPQPGISHVPLSWTRIGYLAAARLAAWIKGGKRPGDRETVPPGELVIEASSRAPTDSVVERARLLISEKKDYALTVEEIAASMEISVGTLINRFRSECGRTPKEMLIRWRMEFARRLLAESHEDVAGIAARCGYADHSTFTTAFRKHTGFPPSRWRNRR